jgi:hexosaminidase
MTLHGHKPTPRKFACINCFRLSLAFLALSPQPRATGQTPHHSPLLPQVQHINYGNGSVPLCRLVVTGSYGEDNLALTQIKELLHQRCPSPAPASLPIRVSHDEPGSGLPGVDDHASSASRESYTLTISRSGVQLHGRTSAGIFYAVQTLRQLIEESPDRPQLPFVEIQDWPSLPYRGFMMDMSHGAVLTVDEVKRQLDALSQWKGNQYFFYTETTIDLVGYPLLHQDWNWTPSEVRTIIDYARQRHIDVVPCVELFGHLHDLFREERYSALSALPHGGEANPANSEVDAILEDWLRQYAALFPSPWLHLGFDEPFELERAGSAAAGGTAPDVLWLQHLQRMAGLAAKLGKRPLFWADIDEGAYIFNKYPGLAAALPKDAISTPWFYDARLDYSNLLDLFAQNHVPILVATGISDWDNITPDFDSTFINIDGFLAAGRKAGALGMLNTEWSDSAQALHREATPTLAYGAIAAWQSQPVDRTQFFSKYAQLHYPSSFAPKIAAALASITRSQTLLLEALGSQTSFRIWDDPFDPQTLARITQHADKLRAARLSAEDAIEDLIQSQPLAAPPDQSDDIASLLLAARMLDFTGMKFLYATEIAANFNALPSHPTKDDLDYLLARETSARNHSRVADLMDTAGELQATYRAEWLKQYRPYRLSTALARWQAEQEYWRHFQASVWTVTRDFRPGDPRPTLNQVLAVR